MEFVMGDILGFGMIGWVYYNTTGYIFTRIISFSTTILATIGLITIIKWLFTRKRTKETPGQKWLRTGKMD